MCMVREWFLAFRPCRTAYAAMAGMQSTLSKSRASDVTYVMWVQFKGQIGGQFGGTYGCLYCSWGQSAASLRRVAKLQLAVSGIAAVSGGFDLTRI